MAILEPVVPYLQRHKRLQLEDPDPQGRTPPQKLTIKLPGEDVRAEVCEVCHADAAIVTITGTPMMPHHQYKKNERVIVRRAIGDHGVEVWKVVSEREIASIEAVDRMARDERRAAAEAAQAKSALAAPAEIQAPETVQSAAESIPTGITERRKVLGPRRSKIAKG